jgi:hypothetical protein
VTRAPTRFQLSTNRTGTHRVVRVELFDTLEQLREAAVARGYARADEQHPPMALMIPWQRPEGGWEDREPRAHLATLWFARDTVTVVEIAHEATHAAAHLYSVDCYRNHARAAAHLHGWNEPLAYLTADIVGHVCRRLIDEGLDLAVGRPRHYGTAEHPPHLPRK